MLTDERIREFMSVIGTVGGTEIEAVVGQFKIRQLCRAVEAEAREDADECITAQEDLLRELRAERDELRALLREWRDINDGETGGNSWASLIDRTDAALAK